MRYTCFISDEKDNLSEQTCNILEGVYAITIGGELSVKIFAENVTAAVSKYAAKN
jgi:hypothetical protein